MSDDPVLMALAARLYCIGELINGGDTKGAKAIVDKVLKILPAPGVDNVLCAMREAGYYEELLDK